MNIENFNNYYRIVDNELMEMLNEKPWYIIHGQFRNTQSGEMRLFERVVFNKRNYEFPQLINYLYYKFEKFIEEKEASGQYNFVPYEAAIYDFPNKNKDIRTWKAKVFYDEEEKESHKFFLKLARMKEA